MHVRANTTYSMNVPYDVVPQALLTALSDCTAFTIFYVYEFEQVGYPNVGKSSTINTILRNKKVSVSATPGHTKHFQVHDFPLKMLI